MKVIIKRVHYLSRADYKFIREQLKADHIKMKDFAKDVGLSRRALYDQLVGNTPCCIDLLTYLDFHGIKTYHEGEYIE